MRHLLITCSLLLISAALARADDWPLPYHDSANTCVSSERIRLPLRLAWRIPGASIFQMVAANGRLYTVDPKRLVARDLRSGRQLWTARGGASLCLYRDRVIVGGTQCSDRQPQALAAYRVSDGQELWHTSGGAGATALGGVTVYEDRLYLANGGGGLWAVDPETGHLLRTAGAMEAGISDIPAAASWGVPAFTDARAYLGFGHNGYLVTLPEMQTRALGLWDSGAAYPIFWNGYLVTQGPVLQGHSFHLQDNSAENVRTWYADKGVGHGLAPVGEGLVLEKESATGAYLVAHDLVTGERRWTRPMIVTSMSSATQDLVFVVGDHRRPDWQRRFGGAVLGDYAVLHVLDARSGKVRGQYPLEGPASGSSAYGKAPLLAEGHVVVSTAGGLYCFRSR